jgi:hypothetical protein
MHMSHGLVPGATTGGGAALGEVSAQHWYYCVASLWSLPPSPPPPRLQLLTPQEILLLLHSAGMASQICWLQHPTTQACLQCSTATQVCDVDPLRCCGDVSACILHCMHPTLPAFYTAFMLHCMSGQY